MSGSGDREVAGGDGLGHLLWPFCLCHQRTYESGGRLKLFPIVSGKSGIALVQCCHDGWKDRRGFRHIPWSDWSTTGPLIHSLLPWLASSPRRQRPGRRCRRSSNGDSGQSFPGQPLPRTS